MIDNWQNQAKIAAKVLQSHLGLARKRMHLAGDWQDHHLEIEFFKGKNVTTRFRLSQKHVFNTSFQLSRQGVLDNLFGPTIQQDIIIGANEFDDAVVIQAWKTEAIKQLLQCEEVRQASLDIFNDPRFADISISNQSITASVEGVVKGKLEVESILYLLQTTAEAFDQAGNRVERHQPVDEVVETAEPEPILEIHHEPELEPEEDKPEIILVEQPLQLQEQPVTRPLQPAEKTEADYKKGATISVFCRLNYIIPQGNGWVLVGQINEAGILNKGEVRWLIGELTYQELTQSNPKADLVINGEVLKFDPVNKHLILQSSEPVSAAQSKISATVAIRV